MTSGSIDFDTTLSDTGVTVTTDSDNNSDPNGFVITTSGTYQISFSLISTYVADNSTPDYEIELYGCDSGYVTFDSAGGTQPIPLTGTATCYITSNNTNADDGYVYLQMVQLPNNVLNIENATLSVQLVDPTVQNQGGVVHHTVKSRLSKPTHAPVRH